MLFEVQESQKLGAISSHEQLLRASTNCQMQTNTFNNLKLIYCTGKAVERKKQIHVGMEVDNRYDKFVVLEWLRKALCSFCVSKCIVEQSNEAADMRFVSGAGTLCPAPDMSLLERSCQKETERRTWEFLYKREDDAK